MAVSSMAKKRIRIGIMGFGRIGRQLYHLAAASDDIEIVAISDIGKTDVLHYLLNASIRGGADYELEGNYLVCPAFRTRMLKTDRPEEVPWDLFDMDLVVEATGRYQLRESMQAHLNGGAGRVMLSTLPIDYIDRLVIAGINENEIAAADKMISAGSPTTTAFALLLKVLGDALEIECASMTSVHAYTSDQSLQDYASRDFRRSRSAAENIIPNTTDSAIWAEKALPQFKGRLSASALNVPVQQGSLLDTNLVFKNRDVSAEDVNRLMLEASKRSPHLIEVTTDPVVSSDVIGNRHSLLFDAIGTLKGGGRMMKTLGWYESMGHASRMLELARAYAALDRGGAS